MSLTTTVIVNAILALFLVGSLVYLLLAHGVHADRHHRRRRIRELGSLPPHRRDRVAS